MCKKCMFKNVIFKMCLEIMYFVFLYKKDLALNDLRLLICYKINQTEQHIL